jgi:DNA mismatch endonuclease (patch repair protein)
MADIFSSGKRSQIMSRIRSSGTKPEVHLHAVIQKILGKRRRIDLNVMNLPGCPDVVVPSLKLAIFADGCFYHGCPKHGHTPKSNDHYWGPKLTRNLQRDRVSRRKLRFMGYSVWRVWEHDLRPARLERTINRLQNRVKRWLVSADLRERNPGH